jgi:hypothetical protein
VTAVFAKTGETINAVLTVTVAGPSLSLRGFVVEVELTTGVAVAVESGTNDSKDISKVETTPTTSFLSNRYFFTAETPKTQLKHSQT